MFENYRTFETTYAGRPIIVETGKTCGLSNGSCWVRYGDTVVMANVTASAKPREGVDFFPLSVDYEEKLSRFKAALSALKDSEISAQEKNRLLKSCIDRIDYNREKSYRLQREPNEKKGERFKSSGGYWSQSPIELQVKLKI